MTEEIKKKKTCNNCRYFMQHYTIIKRRLRPVEPGHCGYSAAKNKLALCKHWEDIAEEKAERRTLIKNTLEEMSCQLTQIRQILQNDQD